MNGNPEPTPETRHFWDGALEDRLVLQRCNDCGAVYFPPRAMCPVCGSRSIAAFDASGRATLYSYVISHVGPPGWSLPFVVAIVQLAEGPRMLTNIIDVDPDPECLPLDLELEVCFQVINEKLKKPVFRPANRAGVSL